jgi:hypothetical protein
MQVSFQSKLCLTACTLISAYSAYSKPTYWITSFAIGVLMGTCQLPLPKGRGLEEN